MVSPLTIEMQFHARTFDAIVGVPDDTEPLYHQFCKRLR